MTSTTHTSIETGRAKARVAAALRTESGPAWLALGLAALLRAPVLFVYARSGQGGESFDPTDYGAAKEPKGLWAVESGHPGALSAEPEEYERRVVGFLDRALLESDPPLRRR